MKYNPEHALSYDDICLVPSYSELDSRLEANIKSFGYSNPLANSPMIHTSTENMIRYLHGRNMMTCIHRYFKNAEDQLDYATNSLKDKYRDLWFAVGKSRDWILTLIDNGVDKFLIDMAHGDSKACVDTISYIKSRNASSTVIAGNVATPEGYLRLLYAGADIIRVGIASGSICSTAKNTAFGVPIVTSLMECGSVKGKGKIIACGGIRSASDILKAIACGADMVFCGKLLASTSLSEGPFYDSNKNIVEIKDEPWAVAYAEYAGMASHEMRMRNNTHKTKNVSIEGVSGLIKYNGETSEVLDNVEANLRAGLSYCGARDWEYFYRNVKIRRMSTAGIIEKETHLDA